MPAAPGDLRGGLRLGTQAHPADGLGQGHQVVGERTWGDRTLGQMDDLPATRNAQTGRMSAAQVVASGLGTQRQRAHDRGGIGVHIGEGRHRRL